MKTRLLGLFSSFFLLASISFSQNQSSDFGVWKIMNEKSGVEIYAKHELCLVEYAPNEYHIMNLKITNTTSENREVSFYIKNYYEEGENGSLENIAKLTLMPNQTVEGNCSGSEPFLSQMIANPKLENGWKYIKSEIIIESIK